MYTLRSVCGWLVLLALDSVDDSVVGTSGARLLSLPGWPDR